MLSALLPADEVSNGFDNIGDVLSLSPVLLEKYLKAAEAAKLKWSDVADWDDARLCLIRELWPR